MRSRCAERAAAAALVTCALVLPHPSRGAAARWRIIRSSVPGFELRYPAGWRATLRSDHGVAISTFRTAQPDSFPPRPAGSAYIVVFDYGHMQRPLPARPARLRLPTVGRYEGFGVGSMLDFRQDGHSFQVFVGFGRGASAATRSLALRTIKSLTTTAPPLANDYRTTVLGPSVEGRPIRAYHLGDFASHHPVLVVGCIHGTECAGMAITLQLLDDEATRANVWVIQDLNPDGLHAGTRVNADGVDLNRNFSSGWQPIGRRGDPQYPGPRPFSEPETRVVRDVIERIHPRITIWFHQPAALVRADGPSVPAARRYAHLIGLPFRRMPWLAGTAPNWQNHRFPDSSSFVVELPSGQLSLATARRDAAAILQLAATG
jgi:protein MpaA